MTVLVLGGTEDGRRLACRLHDAGVAVISALAGRLAVPRLPAGDVRIGGFGGPEGLASWLDEHEIGAVVDATHPHAARISASARAACARQDVPLLRLERSGWSEQPGDRWTRVDSVAAAAAVVPSLGARVLLALGRQEVAAFADVREPWFLIRCIEAPAGPLPPRGEVLLARGPFTLEAERALLDAHGIDLVVTRDSGSGMTSAKLEAARERGIPVMIVQRPARLDVPTVTTVEDAHAWVRLKGRAS